MQWAGCQQTEYDNGDTSWEAVHFHTTLMRMLCPQLASCQSYLPKVADPHGVLPDFMELLLDDGEILELLKTAVDPKNKNVRAASSCKSIANMTRRHPEVLLVLLFAGETENWVISTFRRGLEHKNKSSAYRQLDKPIHCLAAALKTVVRTSEEAAAVRRGYNWRDEHGGLSTFRTLHGLLSPFHGRYKDLTFMDNFSIPWYGGPSCVSMLHAARFQETLDLFIRTAMSHTHELENGSFHLRLDF